MDEMRAVEALGALAQESRLKVFRLLVRSGPPGLPAGAIGERLGLPGATLSFHLTQLVRAGLVTATREGRSIVYAVSWSGMQDLMAFLLEQCCEGVACIPAASVKTRSRRSPAGAQAR